MLVLSFGPLPLVAVAPCATSGLPSMTADNYERSIQQVWQVSKIAEWDTAWVA